MILNAPPTYQEFNESTDRPETVYLLDRLGEMPQLAQIHFEFALVEINEVSPILDRIGRVKNLEELQLILSIGANDDELDRLSLDQLKDLKKLRAFTFLLEPIVAEEDDDDDDIWSIVCQLPPIQTLETLGISAHHDLSALSQIHSLKQVTLEAGHRHSLKRALHSILMGNRLESLTILSRFFRDGSGSQEESADEISDVFDLRGYSQLSSLKTLIWKNLSLYDSSPDQLFIQSGASLEALHIPAQSLSNLNVTAVNKLSLDLRGPLNLSNNSSFVKAVLKVSSRALLKIKDLKTLELIGPTSSIMKFLNEIYMMSPSQNRLFLCNNSN